jgi:hypothetical protein
MDLSLASLNVGQCSGKVIHCMKYIQLFLKFFMYSVKQYSSCMNFIYLYSFQYIGDQ